VKWLLRETVVAVHDDLISEHGGLPGYDENKLESTLARPANKLDYSDDPDLADLAAYGFGFARNHVFTDGNKRIALMSVYIFLQINGFELEATEPEAVTSMERLAAGEFEEVALAQWIRDHLVPLD